MLVRWVSAIWKYAFRPFFSFVKLPSLDNGQYVHYSGNMDKTKAVEAFAALAQDTRLTALRVLVEHGRSGLPAGELADRLAVPHNTLSFHLSHLVRAGLVASRRNGRKVIYVANIDELKRLGQFLLANCCIRESAESPHCDQLIEGNRNDQDSSL